jgi:hypothetical protein
MQQFCDFPFSISLSE